MGGFEVQGVAGEGWEIDTYKGELRLPSQLSDPSGLPWSLQFLLLALSRRGHLPCLLQWVQQAQYRLALHLS